MTPVKAVSYLRVSTDDQALSLEAQRAGIAKWAESRQVRLVGEFIDEDVHGDDPIADRPGLSQALGALKGVKYLVALRRDRVARSPLETLLLERELAKSDVLLVTADGLSDDRSPEGELLRGLLDLFAAFELKQTRRRTREALAAKRARGERLGAPPYGFAQRGPVLEEQCVIAMARALRVAGYTIRQIAKDLERRGIRSRKGRPLGLAQVHSILETRAA